MKQAIEILEERICSSMQDISGQPDCRAIVRPAADAKFGDYQANGVMAIAKKLRTNPRELAEKIVTTVDLSDICSSVEVAGPGFINMTLSDEFVGTSLLKMSHSANVGISRHEKPETVVVDFSGPNVAKQMHVGHLRSTILGDCICRMLECLGNNVVRQNHIGDWGTQFGMLIAYLKRTNPAVLAEPDSVQIKDLEEFYRCAKALCDTDAEFSTQARQEVIKLHNHNPETIAVWKQIVAESRRHYQPIYETLGVKLDASNERGESFYADKLSGVVTELEQTGLAKESNGAVCVFLDGFKNKDESPLPFIIRKSDGAFLYATTDLAAIQYRINEIGAAKVIYVTDARQKLHFEMLFATARLAGWVKDNVETSHVTFGSVQGPDGKPLKTREGKNVKLNDLLGQAVDRAMIVVEEKNPELTKAEQQTIAEAVGIGAVKYADYSNNRESDYIFSFDKMLAMDGNTAPYMQYAYARVKSIGRKAKEKAINIQAELTGFNTLNLTDDQEKELSKHLIRYGQIVENAASEYRPNYLTNYLYELAQKYSSFYTNCPVLTASDEKRATRLFLCELTARVIKHGLSDLLGIKVVEKM